MPQTPERKRTYMRSYMARLRADKRGNPIPKSLPFRTNEQGLTTVKAPLLIKRKDVSPSPCASAPGCLPADAYNTQIFSDYTAEELRALITAMKAKEQG